MKRGGWVPMDKALLKALPINRPYTVIEAAFSVQCDLDNGHVKGEREYSRIFSWSREKARNFLKKQIAPLSGHKRIHRNRPLKFRFIEKLQRKDNQIIDQLIDHEKTTTNILINPSHPNPLISNKEKGVAPEQQVPTPSPLSFKAWKNKIPKEIPFDVGDIPQAIEYFLKVYEEGVTGGEHPRLRPSQWKQYILSMYNIADEDRDIELNGGELALDDWQILIDAYFRKDFEAGCDYKLMHFASTGVLKNIFYENLY